MITPLRTGPELSAMRFAQIATELSELGDTHRANPRLSLARRTFKLLARSGGSLPADSVGRQAMHDVYRVLQLDLGRRWAEGQMTPPLDIVSPPADNTAGYLAPDEAVYQLEDDYDAAMSLLNHEEGAAARPCLMRALRGFYRRGGVFQVRAADCLLGLSVLDAREGRPEQALRYAAQAHHLYERWFRLPESVSATLNQVGLMDVLGQHAPALALANKAEQVARALQLTELIVDAFCARTALASEHHPESAAVVRLRHVAPAYRNTFPARRAAYEACLARVQRANALNTAKHRVTAMLGGSFEHDGGALARILADAPEAAGALTGPVFLRGSIPLWQRVGDLSEQAMSALNRSHHAHAVLCERLVATRAAVRIWMDGAAASFEALTVCPPAMFVPASACEVHLYAARRLSGFVERWAESHWDDYRQLRALGELAAIAAASLAREGQGDELHSLLAASADCRPDGDIRFAAHCRTLHIDPVPYRTSPDCALFVHGERSAT